MTATKTLEQVVAESVAKIASRAQEEKAEMKEAGRLAGAEAAGECTRTILRKLQKDVAFAGPDIFIITNPNYAYDLHLALDQNEDLSYEDFWKHTIGVDGVDLIEDEQFAIGFVEGIVEVVAQCQKIWLPSAD